MMNSGMPGAAPGWGDFANHQPATTPANSEVGGPNTLAALAGKSNKIVYYTPVIGPGLKIGIAYTPEAGDGPASRGGFTTDNETSDFGTTVEVAVSLINKVGKGSLNTYAAYIKSSRETSETGEQDQTAWSIGAKYGVGAWSIGARYKTDDEGVIADSDEKHYGLGASFKQERKNGDIIWALNYVKGEDENGGGTAADDMTFLQLSMAYTWGPGVTLAAGIQNTKYEDGGSVAADENNATVVFMGTSLNF
jgi:predicted porin